MYLLLALCNHLTLMTSSHQCWEVLSTDGTIYHHCLIIKWKERTHCPLFMNQSVQRMSPSDTPKSPLKTNGFSIMISLISSQLSGTLGCLIETPSTHTINLFIYARQKSPFKPTRAKVANMQHRYRLWQAYLNKLTNL